MLEAAGVPTLGALAVQSLRSLTCAQRLERVAGQACFWCRHERRLGRIRRSRSSRNPRTQWGRRFSVLPRPDHGDVFLDFEGHPFRRPATGLFFLLGLIARGPDGEWRYEARWEHDREGRPP